MTASFTAGVVCTTIMALGAAVFIVAIAKARK